MVRRRKVDIIVGCFVRDLRLYFFVNYIVFGFFFLVGERERRGWVKVVVLRGF